LISNSSIYYCLLVINPENQICQDIKAIKRSFKLKHGKYGGSGSTAHITLNREFLDGKELKKFINRLKEELSTYYTFDLHLNNYDFFFESNTFFVSIEESSHLANLQRLITTQLKMIKPISYLGRYRFSPHMTIGRTLSHRQFSEAYYEFERQVYSKKFRVNDIAVLYSQIGDSRYESLNLPLKNEDWAVVY
jgi:2'-5' RNA ligase